MVKLIAASFIVAVLVAPAMAADEFWIVQDSTTKKCMIVQEKPKTSSTMVIGNTAFKTRTEAETSLKTTKVCTVQ